jgi:hypothetical protein
MKAISIITVVISLALFTNAAPVSGFKKYFKNPCAGGDCEATPSNSRLRNPCAGGDCEAPPSNPHLAYDSTEVSWAFAQLQIPEDSSLRQIRDAWFRMLQNNPGLNPSYASYISDIAEAKALADNAKHTNNPRSDLKDASATEHPHADRERSRSSAATTSVARGAIVPELSPLDDPVSNDLPAPLDIADESIGPSGSGGFDEN